MKSKVTQTSERNSAIAYPSEPSEFDEAAFEIAFNAYRTRQSRYFYSRGMSIDKLAFIDGAKPSDCAPGMPAWLDMYKRLHGVDFDPATMTYEETPEDKGDNPELERELQNELYMLLFVTYPRHRR
jgi:hypothetical protein